MDFKYIKECYDVPACIGRKVEINGKSGVIVKDMGDRIGVLFDSDKPSHIYPAHPTRKIKYLGMGKVRNMTRSQKRYKAYLELGDCFDTFIDFCRWYDYKEPR